MWIKKGGTHQCYVFPQNWLGLYGAGNVSVLGRTVAPRPQAGAEPPCRLLAVDFLDFPGQFEVILCQAAGTMR